MLVGKKIKTVSGVPWAKPDVLRTGGMRFGRDPPWKADRPVLTGNAR